MANSIIERVKNEGRNLQTLYDELQVQMALGKAEARDLLEVERKKLKTYINKQREELNKSSSMVAEDRREFLTCVEDLESVLNEEVPTKAKMYDAYKNKLLSKVYALEEEVRENFPAVSANMQEVLTSFKAKMDAFRVNLALHDKDDPEKVERIRAEFTDKLAEIRLLLSERETAQTRLDNFVEDLSSSFSYLKRAIADLTD
jgi:hypothetical protein